MGKRRWGGVVAIRTFSCREARYLDSSLIMAASTSMTLLEFATFKFDMEAGHPSELLPLPRWSAGGAQGMRLPVGVFASRQRELYTLTFDEWIKRAADVKLAVKAFQDPLHYMIILRKIEKAEKKMRGSNCQWGDCGAHATVKHLRLCHRGMCDLCPMHTVSAYKRGHLLEGSAKSPLDNAELDGTPPRWRTSLLLRRNGDFRAPAA